ncbi:MULTISPECIES: hypothetical protein [Bacillus]|jgi:flagellar biosynthesis/type III secretory pathway M-ring protein FliF/YscJ|uniref:Uncharacterized protein n=1 Tax=Bacillus cereus TaxID=1396 RepID=A0A9W7US31_BACCE|nr:MULTISPECIES: hypothetical protein [Bacillus]MBR3336935.1 hypothetical protein [Bacillus sp. (in: firmicutes)]MDV8113152.1 hypothetical protein [Bacillus sp. BAU-SS-2023]CEY20029.1 Uncharacterised protein [Streptococcus pneumoniae]AQQ65721.1 hypothetical Protein FORC21_4926 [Bacillus cereus]ASK17123.1 hypothetical protein BA201_25385 [Bacillus cereus]
MKKINILISILIILFLCLVGFIFFNDTTKNERYIIWEKNVQENNSLLKKLQNNDIPYKIDKKGNLEIREKDINKATLCCT